jgi:hypothetical protein
MCFKEIDGMRLILVAADLNSGQPVLYGTHPDDSILEGVLPLQPCRPGSLPWRRTGGSWWMGAQSAFSRSKLP